MKKNNYIILILWFHGFQLFLHIVHPVVWPFKILKKITTRYKKNWYSQNHGTLVPKEVPKIIWTFWAQGWDDAPPLVRLCRDSWILQNPDWKVISLTKEDIFKYVELGYSLDGKDVTNTNYSNILRVALLAKHGGVWTDTTTLCVRPLNSWLPQLMQSGFFAFNKPKTTVADWFMAVEKDHVLMKTWMQYVNTYWRFAKKEGRYFWPHYLFEYMITLNGKVRDIWRSTPQINADGPYTAQRYFKTGTPVNYDDLMRTLVDSRFPVHKLDWRIQIPNDFLEKVRKQLTSSV